MDATSRIIDSIILATTAIACLLVSMLAIDYTTGFEPVSFGNNHDTSSVVEHENVIRLVGSIG